MQVLQGFFQLSGQFYGTRVRLLGHGEQYGGLTFFRGQTQFGLLAASFYVSNVFQHDRRASYGFDDRPAHFPHVVGRDDSTYDVFVAVLVNHSAVGVGIHVPRDIHYLAQRHSVVFHPFGVQQNLVFFDVAAQYGYLGYSSGGHQARANHPIGQCAQVEHRRAVGCQSYDKQFSQNGRLRSQSRVTHIVGQAFRHCGQLFRYDLTGQVYVRVPVEFHPYDREARGGRGAYAAYAGGTVDGCLYGESDQLFHLFGCHAPGFCHDDNRGRVQVGKDVYFRMVGLVEASYHQQDGGYQYK